MEKLTRNRSTKELDDWWKKVLTASSKAPKLSFVENPRLHVGPSEEEED